MSELLNKKKILILILVFTFLTRFFRIDYPTAYVFDEVYHAFTAKEYAKLNIEAWEWWTKPPPGVAFEWTHPPLAKEIMALSVFIFRTGDAWAYRLPGVLFGVLSVYLVYSISKKLFNNHKIALLSSFFFSIEGLNFVQSRTGMNDIYFVAFMLLSLYLLLSDKFLLSSIALGLVISTKWTGFYFIIMCLIILLVKKRFLKILFFIVIPPIIYLLSYLPFFLHGHSLDQFIELQKQMWWYHTGLKASHDYSSSWWSWPFNLYPVWYFVEYHKNGWISNIFASGNPFVFWLGFGAVIVAIGDFLFTRSKSLFVLLLGFLIFWLPWAVSPRIMFLYHYTPSIPFLTMILGYELYNMSSKKDERLIITSLTVIGLLIFLLLYPILTGIPLPKDLLMFFFSTNLTKNPFGG